MSLGKLDDDIYALACGLDLWLASYVRYKMNGIKFHTKECERHQQTQSSEVFIHDKHQGLLADFFSVLQDIIKLRCICWHKV